MAKAPNRIRRIFNGHYYHFGGFTETKNQAQSLTSKLRKQGKFARYTVASTFPGKIYHIWVRE